MRKILLITHLGYGSPRILGLVKYLPEFNLEPLIVTGFASQYKDLPVRIMETPYPDAFVWLKRLLGLNPEKDARQQVENRFSATSGKSPVDFLLTLGGEIVNYPCPAKNWRPFALKAAREILRTEEIEAIISSSTPVASHLIASKLKAEFKMPWLADFRDLWSQNHNYGYSRFRRTLDRRLEIKTLSLADALVATSEPWAEKLRTLHQGKPVHMVTHGFSPDEINEPSTELIPKFTITYTGNIYQGKQNPGKLLAALRDLTADGAINADDIEVRFYGRELGWLGKEIEHYGLKDVVKQYGPVPRHSAVERQRESQLLLLLDWDDPQEKGVYPAKVFEYLGAQRPILATGGVAGNVVEVLLDETKAGVHAPTTEDVKSALIGFYEEYKQSGTAVYSGLKAEISKYTHREMAKQFADILDRLS